MTKELFLQKWDSRIYLETYYKDVEPDEIETIQWVVELLVSQVQGKPHTLIYGIGPAIKDAIPIAPYASAIDVADFNPLNLAELVSWDHGNTDMFPWTRFTIYTLQCEGVNATEKVINERESLVRERINRYIQSDADRIPVVRTSITEKSTGFRAPYDLVASMYCIDSSTGDKEVWRQRMRNVARLVAPGGLFITAALANTTYYEVGDMRFPSANVSTGDMREVLMLDFLPESVTVEEREVSGHGYNSILLAYAWMQL